MRIGNPHHGRHLVIGALLVVTTLAGCRSPLRLFERGFLGTDDIATVDAPIDDDATTSLADVDDTPADDTSSPILLAAATVPADADLPHDASPSRRLGAPTAIPDPRSSILVPEERPTHLDPRSADAHEITLDEILHLALGNTTIVRDDSQFLSASNPVLASPNFVPSAYDADIQATGGPGGIGGIGQAKAAFDPYFLSGTSYGTNNLVQNNRFLSGGLTPGSVLNDDTGLFTSRLEKRLDPGTFLSLNHDLNYSANNQPNRFFPSAYSGLVRAEFRQPLLAGYGKEFTSIAGPIGRSPSAVQPVDRGLVIARINQKVSVTDFEANVQNLLRAVRSGYWDLVLAYAIYHDQVAARDAAEELWERVRSRRANGLNGIGAADEALARERFHEWESTADNALSDLLEAEARLRRLAGLPAGPHELFRPADDLRTAEVHVDWFSSLAEALSLRLELRRQKSNVQSLALQLTAARSLKKPRFDVVSGAQLNGFGDDLFGRGGVNSAYGSLLGFDQTGWDVGLEFSMPFGNRAANTLVQNVQLRLTKARAALAAAETEIGHELAHAFRELERWRVTIEKREQRFEASRDRTRAVAADYDAGRTDLDSLLRARTSLLQASIELAQARAQYHKAITNLHYRRGTILEDATVRLAESEPEPRVDAERTWTSFANSPAMFTPDD